MEELLKSEEVWKHLIVVLLTLVSNITFTGIRKKFTAFYDKVMQKRSLHEKIDGLEKKINILIESQPKKKH